MENKELVLGYEVIKELYEVVLDESFFLPDGSKKVKDVKFNSLIKSEVDKYQDPDATWKTITTNYESAKIFNFNGNLFALSRGFSSRPIEDIFAIQLNEEEVKAENLAEILKNKIQKNKHYKNSICLGKEEGIYFPENENALILARYAIPEESRIIDNHGRTIITFGNKGDCSVLYHKKGDAHVLASRIAEVLSLSEEEKKSYLINYNEKLKDLERRLKNHKINLFPEGKSSIGELRFYENN